MAKRPSKDEAKVPMPKHPSAEGSKRPPVPDDAPPLPRIEQTGDDISDDNKISVTSKAKSRGTTGGVRFVRSRGSGPSGSSFKVHNIFGNSGSSRRSSSEDGDTREVGILRPDDPSVNEDSLESAPIEEPENEVPTESSPLPDANEEISTPSIQGVESGQETSTPREDDAKAIQLLTDLTTKVDRVESALSQLLAIIPNAFKNFVQYADD